MVNMKKVVLIIAFLLSIVTLGAPMAEAWSDFTLTSKTIKEGALLQNEQVYNGYGCSGKNISPDLEWANTPAWTKSFAIVMHDPDAPVAGGWYHWIVTNIPANKRSYRKGADIGYPAVLSKTSFGKPGYGGPCPPVGHGKHRYIITVYALNVETINSTSNSTPDQIMALINAHLQGKASIMGYYRR